MKLNDKFKNVNSFGPHEKRKFRTRYKIEKACRDLINQNKLLTVNLVAQESGITIPTVIKYRNLISKYDGDLLIEMYETILGEK